MNRAFRGIEKTSVIKAYNISVYGIDFSSDQANKPMIKIKINQSNSIKGPARPEDSGGKYRRRMHLLYSRTQGASAVGSGHHG